MAKFIEFSLRHWQLVLAFIGLTIALIITESRRAGKTISSASAVRLINQHNAVVLDLREHKEFTQGHITGAINIPFAAIKDRLAELTAYKDTPIILVCKIGQHSGTVGKQLNQAGFTQVCRLFSGMSGWQADGLPVIKG